MTKHWNHVFSVIFIYGRLTESENQELDCKTDSKISWDMLGMNNLICFSSLSCMEMKFWRYLLSLARYWTEHILGNVFRHRVGTKFATYDTQIRCWGSHMKRFAVTLWQGSKGKRKEKINCQWQGVRIYGFSKRGIYFVTLLQMIFLNFLLRIVTQRFLLGLKPASFLFYIRHNTKRNHNILLGSYQGVHILKPTKSFFACKYVIVTNIADASF